MHKFKSNQLGKNRWGLVRFDGETVETFENKNGLEQRYAVEFLEGAEILGHKNLRLQGEVAKDERNAAEALIAAINEASAQRGS